MDKVKEFRGRAEECRKLGKIAPPDLRQHYFELANMWDRLAEERLTFFVADKVPGSDATDTPTKES